MEATPELFVAQTLYAIVVGDALVKMASLTPNTAIRPTEAWWYKDCLWVVKKGFKPWILQPTFMPLYAVAHSQYGSVAQWFWRFNAEEIADLPHVGERFRDRVITLDAYFHVEEPQLLVRGVRGQVARRS